MTRLRVSREAEEELAEAADWYERRRAGLGVELIAVVDSALEAIAGAPLAHPLWRTDRPYRIKVLQRFPYVLLFRCEEDLIIVVAVAHSKRRPGYWRGDHARPLRPLARHRVPQLESRSLRRSCCRGCRPPSHRSA